MCLTTVKEKFSGKGKRVYSGWKVFEWNYAYRETMFAYQFNDISVSRKVPINKWIHTTKAFSLREASGFQNYQVGFHIYTKRPNRILGIYNQFETLQFIQKVRYKGIFARGTQNGLPVVVTKSMYVTKRRIRKK